MITCICYVRRPRIQHAEEYKTCGCAFIESEMTLRFSMCSHMELFSVGSGVSFFFFQQLGIITDHAEREREREQRSGCLFIDASLGVVALPIKKRLSDAEHRAGGKRQHAVLCL